MIMAACRGGLNNISPSRHWKILSISFLPARLGVKRPRLNRPRTFMRGLDQVSNSIARIERRIAPSLGSPWLISQMKVSLYRRDASASVRGCALADHLSPLGRCESSQRLPLRSKTNGEAWETVSHSPDSDLYYAVPSVYVASRETIESHAGVCDYFYDSWTDHGTTHGAT